MRPSDVIRLRHMRDAAREAGTFTAGRSRDDLDTDRMLVLALIKLVEIIGEAANQVSADGRAACPGLPWQDIIAMRNRLIHAYFAINRDIVWQTIKVDLPPLIDELDRLLPAADLPE